MIPEVEVVQHVYNIVGAISILLLQFLQYSNLDQGLMMKTFLIPYYLNSNMLICFVI